MSCKTRLGLTQAASADFLTQHDPGLVSIVASVKAEDTQKAKDAILEEIEQIRAKGISQDDDR